MTRGRPAPTRPIYELLEHTADLAIRVYGPGLAELFANAAYAMLQQLVDLERIGHAVERHIEVQGIDYESLLVNWLNELLYLHDTHREVYSSVQVEELSPVCLRAKVRGERTTDARTIIKAATYHNLSIEAADNGYEATVVFDV